MGRGQFLSIVAGATLFCATSIAFAQQRPMPRGMMEMGKITAIDAASGTITVQHFAMRGPRGHGKPGGNSQTGSGAKGSTGGNGSAQTNGQGQGQARGSRPMMRKPMESKLAVAGSTVVKDAGGQTMALTGLQVGDMVRIRGKFNAQTKTMEVNEIQKSKVPVRRPGK